MTDEPTIVLVDDHPLLASSLQSLLQDRGATAEVVAVGDGDDHDRLIDLTLKHEPDCVVVDLGLPIEGGGAPLVPALVERGTAVAVLTGETDPSLLAGCAADGAAVVLAKTEPLPEIVETVMRVSGGGTVRPNRQAELRQLHQRLTADRQLELEPFDRLSPREQRVLAGLMAGHGINELAERHIVSIETVRSQVKSVLKKLGVSSQLQAVARAHDADWQPPAGVTDPT